MPCPLFEPREVWTDWTGPSRVPLGEPYRGRCAATGAPPETATQMTLCNFGYARGRCAVFPDSEAADAFRFSMRGAELVWIVERAHAPVQHGTMDSRQVMVPAHTPMQGQARAFLESYRKGKFER
jgi:hypothetical protein